MFNFAGASSQAVADEALTLSAKTAAAHMTLREKVNALFEQLHMPVFRYVMRKTRDSGRAEDITQETFLRLCRDLKQEGSLDNPKAWLFTFASNLAIDASREDRHIQDLDEAPWNRIEESRQGATDPEKLTLQQERLERLQSVVLSLTALQRDCLHLRAEGFRYREIAGADEYQHLPRSRRRAPSHAQALPRTSERSIVMSADMRKSEMGAGQHPDGNQLLLALERELSLVEAAEVEGHLGVCWECRARYHEMHRGILAFVEYRDKLYIPALEFPPRDFGQFPSLLNQTAAESFEARLIDRIRARLRAFFRFAQSSVQAKWVTATAVFMSAVVLWMQVFHPATISASELLSKAEIAQNPPLKHREVRQRIRVKTAKAEIVREFRWETGSPIPNAQCRSDPESWSAPLTAEGFAQWHDSLPPGFNDSVKKSGDRWTIKTTAAGPIREASIVIRVGDFHPTEQHIRFYDNRSLDLEELSFEMTDDASPSANTPAPVIRDAESPVNPSSRETAVPPPAQPTVNLDETELELRYSMFTQHWDDDEDLQVSRTAEAVLLSGTVGRSGNFAS